MQARDLVFRKSSYSNGSGDCVEVADAPTDSYVRDSKTPEGGTLNFPGGTWSAFVKGVKAGEFDV
jgi:hypothetical protein